MCDQLIDSDARALYEAGEGRKGKDCAMFIEILATRSFPHLRQGLLDPSPAPQPLLLSPAKRDSWSSVSI